MADDGPDTVVDTGRVDDLGYPVYESRVVVAPQLLRQRSTDPTTDGGFPSGHTNAAWLAALAFAYAVPERFSELTVMAAVLGDSRITAGMHSPVDVMGGRIMATALAAAILADPVNAELKAAARAQAVEYFTAVTGTSDLYTAAHTGPDEYGDRAANQKQIRSSLTYVLRRQGGYSTDLEVPKGAEVLLETRFPYLSPAQVRDVLRTTALPSGYPLLDGPEQWGRLNLFAAADGFARFDRTSPSGSTRRRAAWPRRTPGATTSTAGAACTLRGTGTLGLTGANSFRGGIRVLGGTLVAGSSGALGSGDVQQRRHAAGERFVDGARCLPSCRRRARGDGARPRRGADCRGNGRDRPGQHPRAGGGDRARPGAPRRPAHRPVPDHHRAHPGLPGHACYSRSRRVTAGTGCPCTSGAAEPLRITAIEGTDLFLGPAAAPRRSSGSPSLPPRRRHPCAYGLRAPPSVPPNRR